MDVQNKCVEVAGKAPNKKMQNRAILSELNYLLLYFIPQSKALIKLTGKDLHNLPLNVLICCLRPTRSSPIGVLCEKVKGRNLAETALYGGTWCAGTGGRVTGYREKNKSIIITKIIIKPNLGRGYKIRFTYALKLTLKEIRTPRSSNFYSD